MTAPLRTLSVTRRLTFSAGHRVAGHENKCRHLHGHNWVLELTAEARDRGLGAGGLDPLGRVIDFGVLKERFGTWIDQRWDHAFLVGEADREAQHALARIVGQRVFLLPANPTAENLALFLLHTLGPELLADTPVVLTRVRVCETENCSAEVTAAEPGRP